MSASFDVEVTVTPVDEPPVITGTTTFNNWQENDDRTIHTYEADDPEDEPDITWTLGGPDRGDFTITDGVLRFAITPDYESPTDSGGNNYYEVTVQATDSNSKRGELEVDVIVQNVAEAPVIAGPDGVDNFPENSATSRQVARYTASNPERAAITWSLSGTDDSAFSLDNGTLTFKESPDYEDQPSYSVTVNVEAGGQTTSKTETINITNIEEAGAVTLSTVQPQAETEVAAELEDPDNERNDTWQWYRTSSRGSTGTTITNATSPFYTPDADDVGSYLRAVASYDDGHGTGKSATAVSANRVQEAPPTPEPPEFPAEGDYKRSIRENTRAGTNLGAPVRATDGNNDRLTYSIPASDDFEIDPSSGQLRTKVELNHEATPTLNIRVTATDPGGLTDTEIVTITVEDVDETPVVSGPTSPEVAENGGRNVATYTATDPDQESIEWVLTGRDSDAFTLSGGGLSRTLNFNAIPDYEEKNQYRVTIEAHEQGDGTSVARLSVTVRVTNVDEPGIVLVPVSEPRVGQQLTPTVVDPDEGVGSIDWKWERRDTGGVWAPIPGATSRSYTPTRDDNGKELRVVAIYRDREGPGKTDTFEFTSPVVLRPFFPTDTATRVIQENTQANRNVGSRFTASHPDNVNLTYEVEGRDAVHFTVDNDGQLKTSATPLDYETRQDKLAVVDITAEDTQTPPQSATITVNISVTDECQSAGEPPCAPRVSPASATSLRVSWSAPSADDHDLQYREAGSHASWTQELDVGASRSHTISGLTTGTEYEVQVRTESGGTSSTWSQSGTGTPGYVPPPPPPPDPDPDPDPPPPVTTTTTTGGGGGGGFSVPIGGFAPPPQPVLTVQRVEQVFQQLTGNNTLVRVWHLERSARTQRWVFYDPRLEFAPFNTLRTMNLVSDPPAIVAINVTRNQQFRGAPLYAGWNFVPVTAQPLAAQPGSGTQPVSQLFRPLAASGALQRAWWLDSRTQEWRFFDPDPELAAFNTLSTVNLAAIPPVVVAVNVTSGQTFRGRTLYRGWNYIVLR